MKTEEFRAFREKLNEECAELLFKTKGLEYSGETDRHANFKRAAAAMGVTPLQALGVFAGKHWDSLCSYFRTGTFHSEAPRERVKDLVNYLVLAAALIEEHG